VQHCLRNISPQKGLAGNDQSIYNAMTTQKLAAWMEEAR